MTSARTAQNGTHNLEAGDFLDQQDLFPLVQTGTFLMDDFSIHNAMNITDRELGQDNSTQLQIQPDRERTFLLRANKSPKSGARSVALYHHIQQRQHLRVPCGAGLGQYTHELCGRSVDWRNAAYPVLRRRQPNSAKAKTPPL
jgi:hypothetical protein